MSIHDSLATDERVDFANQRSTTFASSRQAARELAALSSSRTALRRRWQRRSRGREAGSCPLSNRELERQVVGVSVGRPRVVCDLRVGETFLAHHVSKDFFEATECLRFKRQPSRRSTPFERNPFAERHALLELVSQPEWPILLSLRVIRLGYLACKRDYRERKDTDHRLDRRYTQSPVPCQISSRTKGIRFAQSGLPALLDDSSQSRSACATPARHE